MYNGEVNVSQDDLNSFLAVAEDLKVRGLTQHQATSGSNAQRNSHYKSSTSNSRKTKSPPPSPAVNSKRPRIVEPEVKQEVDDQDDLIVTPEISFAADGDGAPSKVVNPGDVVDDDVGDYGEDDDAYGADPSSDGFTGQSVPGASGTDGSKGKHPQNF